jgi:uncharacterized protein
MRFDQFPRSDRVEDRRGDGPQGFPMGRAGGIGIGTIILLSLLGWALGINPLYLIGGAEILSRLGPSTEQSQPAPRNSEAKAPSDQTGEFVSAVLGSTDMGPFYCPIDQKVYLDTTFFQDIERRFRGCEIGSRSCQFAQAYVITHEIGHHVQNLLGILPEVQQAQQALDQVSANRPQVRVELQADCLAGVWAHHAEQKWRFIEPGDIEAAMQTASAIGDDRLQRKSQGYVVPDAFTHSSSEQRVRWFLNGLKSGQVASCDTYQVAEP